MDVEVEIGAIYWMSVRLHWESKSQESRKSAEMVMRTALVVGELKRCCSAGCQHGEKIAISWMRGAGLVLGCHFTRQWIEGQ
ncbi:hypothetical protein NPIL_373631 [Nephila pilipes]|uniref:Uncharacterized protein n=1 Tax=Nephila pilipes TaxID=299642 RepID=A0A8X6UL01_NEPPI|nr:hypothetical protein NPIL_373631 [Nephila pilipes]